MHRGRICCSLAIYIENNQWLIHYSSWALDTCTIKEPFEWHCASNNRQSAWYTRPFCLCPCTFNCSQAFQLGHVWVMAGATAKCRMTDGRQRSCSRGLNVYADSARSIYSALSWSLKTLCWIKTICSLTYTVRLRKIILAAGPRSRFIRKHL